MFMKRPRIYQRKNQTYRWNMGFHGFRKWNRRRRKRRKKTGKLGCRREKKGLIFTVVYDSRKTMTKGRSSRGVSWFNLSFLWRGNHFNCSFFLSQLNPAPLFLFLFLFRLPSSMPSGRSGKASMDYLSTLKNKWAYVPVPTFSPKKTQKWETHVGQAKVKK